MSNIIKKVLSLGVAVLAIAFVFTVSAPQAQANTCTAVSDGDWHTVSRWSGCGGVLPQAADSVVIPTDLQLTLSGDATITALTFEDPVAAANGITNFNGNSLTVTGATTYTATTGAAGTTIAVGSGDFQTGTLVINDGAAAGDMILSVSTGSITVDGDVSGTWTNAADVQFTSTGASSITFGGHFPSGATLDGTGSTITFNKAGAQNIGAYTTYEDMVISGSGIKTLLGTTRLLAGNLTVSSGTLDVNTQTFTVDGTSSITGTIDLDTGTKTFSDNVTLNSGAVWSETGAAVVVFGGNLTNNATTFTALTGAHTFSGAAGVISGSTATVIPTVHITDDTSNTGTLTVATLLDVDDTKTLTNTGTVTATTALSDITATGAFVNSTNGTLNIGDVIDISSLTSEATGSTVNYTKAGAQTVFDPNGGTAHTYYHLGLSGSGAKTITAATIIIGNLTITDSGTDTTASLSGNANTADKLFFESSLQRSGTWGSTGSTLPAARQNDTHFTAAATGSIAVAHGSSSSVQQPTPYTVTTTGTSSSSSSTTTTTTTTTTTEETPSTTEVVCPVGHMYSATTGQKCTSFSSTTTSPTSGGSYAFGTVLVKSGTRGDACKAWQMFLNDKRAAGLALDGVCGPLTMAAAIAWQGASGLVADGLLGPASRAKAMTQ